MTLMIELTPEQERRLAAVARREGLEPAQLAQRLVTEHLPEAGEEESRNGTAPLPSGVDRNHFYFTATREEFNRALDELAAMNRGLPVLPDAAFDRENLYDERF